ncbi:MAG TPA: AAA family ATPase [Candidatus Saccharimonadales bacterium]|nr:AAA family ATPase [Candidatus Saccharimonadales bacterium]
MTLNCLGGECRQYCQVLDGLTKDQNNIDACEWPERISDRYEFDQTTNPELAQQVGSRLTRVLTTGNLIQDLLNEPGGELSTAFQANSAVLEAQLSLWNSYAGAAKDGRVITDVEVDYYTERLQTAIEGAQTTMKQAGVSPETATHAQAIHDRRTLEDYGLLFDEPMLRTTTQLCVNASSGRSSLVIGDKGIAKTQVAKFVSGLFAPDGRPRFISGDGNMMKDEFIGKMTLSEKNGATVTTFHYGILTECMELGIPFVMDEINLIDPAIVMRLQDILLRKPGDTIFIQEDGGKPITIKPGFCVIATANEASARYQHRAELDPAFRDRFTILPIEYPDGDTVMLRTDELPTSLARLAYAFAVSRNGIASNHVTARDALWLASIAHASQQMYSRPAKDVNMGALGTRLTDVVDDTEPRMSDCITPRRMVEILLAVDSGLNPYDVAAGVRGLTLKTIAGMKRSDDRKNMFAVIHLMHDNPNVRFDAAAVSKQLRI